VSCFDCIEKCREGAIKYSPCKPKASVVRPATGADDPVEVKKGRGVSRRGFFSIAALAAAADGFARVAVGVMIGKAVKLAEGHLDTHSRSTAMNRDFLRSLAARAGCSSEALRAIEAATLARELWTALPEADLAPFMRAVLAACHVRCAPLLPAARLTLLLVPEDGPVRFRN
jgi:cobalamin biosynthesis protein CbiD